MRSRANSTQTPKRKTRKTPKPRENITEYLTIRYRKSEIEVITAAASVRGLTLSAYVRQRSLGKHLPKPISPITATVCELLANLKELLTLANDDLDSDPAQQESAARKLLEALHLIDRTQEKVDLAIAPKSKTKADDLQD
ncbi:hypothetical protein [Oscillatoria sp. FACHB-1406]|uniref:plasmid mobilization protein n=1 Tax=Oscillatoria sp. FACHB-1406 TaxID=2692846 RepID=UPI0016865ED4|nr:hypothetical protein [Oscillatoria sp. FACHB-1406]MBD2580135.1 hypothetical protein [Oscillatoria sp. FACHB-1406]